MTMITGKVTNVVGKDTTYGKMYNVEVDGKSYGAGKFPPKVQPGDYIKFDADTTGRFFKMDTKTVVVVEEPAGIPSPPVYTGSKPSGGGGYNDPERQLNITRQGCRNAAIAWMTLLAAQDALGIKKTASSGERLTALDNMLERYVDDFVLHASTGKRSAESSGLVADSDEAPYGE